MLFSTISHSFLVVDDHHREYEDGLRQAVLADELGYDFHFQTEHHLSPFGGGGIFAMLGAIARITNRIRFGPMVVQTPVQHPLLAAEELAVIDHISGGRLEVGFGRGYRVQMMDQFGRAPEDLNDIHHEALDVIRGVWTHDTFSYSGRFFQFNDVTVLPKPLQKPFPRLWQPVLSPPSVDYCIENKLNPFIGGQFLTDEETKQSVALWRDGVDRLGDPGVLLSGQQGCMVAETNDEARRKFEPILRWAREFAKDLPVFPGSYFEVFRQGLENMDLDKAVATNVVGDPATVIERLRFFEDLGFEHINLYMDVGAPLADVEGSMRLFAEEVMPHFKKPARASANR